MIKAYWNLHKKCWSVMNSKGRVIKHCDYLILRNCTFIVRPAGRERVLKTKRKNVHAFIKGEEYEPPELPLRDKRVRYNPYENPFFTLDGRRIDSAPFMFLMNDGKAYTLMT